MNELQKSNKLSTGRTMAKLTIVCEMSQDAYDMLSHDINRIASLQNGVQKHFNEVMYDDSDSIQIDRIEVNLLSMTHVWRNFKD